MNTPVPTPLLFVLCILVVIAAAIRITRFITRDDLGRWLITDPVDRLMDRYEDRERTRADAEGRYPREPWWWRLRNGLDCAWCTGFHVSWLTLLGTWLWRDVWLWWFILASFALSEVVGQVSKFDSDKDFDNGYGTDSNGGNGNVNGAVDQGSE